MSQARADLLYETSYKDQVCKEADAAIRKTQADAEQSAHSTLNQHRGQAEHMVQTLQGQIQSVEQALSTERSQRTEAETELVKANAIITKESQRFLAQYEACAVARREAERDYAKDKEVLMIAGREAERRRIAAEDCQKSLAILIDEKEQSLSEAQTSLEMAFQQGRLLHDQNEKHEAQINQLQ